MEPAIDGAACGVGLGAGVLHRRHIQLGTPGPALCSFRRWRLQPKVVGMMSAPAAMNRRCRLRTRGREVPHFRRIARGPAHLETLVPVAPSAKNRGGWQGFGDGRAGHRASGKTT